MRKFAILGASALVLALGVTQASATGPVLAYTTGYFTNNPVLLQSQAAGNRGLNDFAAQAPDSSWQSTNQTIILPVPHGR